MGKRQHQKDKMYLTYTEWTTLYGGKKAGTLESTEDTTFRRLPYNHCCVSLQPFEHPYCDVDGNVFELQAIVDYIKRFKHNPVTGKPLDAKSLTKLNFYKNAEGEYHCPVLFKVFTKHSHIVAVKTTGNVYSYEAVEQLNIKTRNWKDLINDQPFERKDLITIHDPSNANKFNLSTFHHIKNNLRVEDEEITKERKDPNAKLKTVSSETREILEELNREFKPVEPKDTSTKDKADKFNAAHYSTGAVAAGFTSTVMPRETTHEAAIVEEDLVRYERVKKKGYVRFITNFGSLNLELYCDVVPKTCENFMKHCQDGYYDGTKLHRSIRNFMIQGGDPTNTGNGGTSIWSKPFEDEFKPNLVHQGRGILSMANSGPNTNGSQFFITYRSCRHLDRKHTVFGKIVGGLDTLNAIEKIEVDNKDRPIEDIIVQRAQVFVDPFQEADEQLAAERAAEIQRLALEESNKKSKNKNEGGNVLKVYRSGVGKYVQFNDEQTKTEKVDTSSEPKPKKIKDASYTFKNFSAW
ncbi:RING-type E3 ubiquitin-protein ligase PPIL2 [Neodiprion pinetum]|uniref:RING-type E3 ubiquitin-protein ligase PPIL2 n=1 Tax=Neodiprion lecontei TaxID=441921 RepID=A0A6J0BQT9_NEOLC|nr:RING-type E3 ubiquitin-protein ligase PPIL2 [Neodiprion lecontei]XP_046428289.1 RING-type E3 ubiquitin-protein ligase PPIL2 [Neodiprion fabricii]XP_046485038.1 RING-type E3 ubiquitin-protein ligase PPIL2 [Neodiprion pinetum]XP_046619383.1 RING-type E3 ubiquitin-protein ligase PPIL2 [Neodiprion virginianus]